MRLARRLRGELIEQGAPVCRACGHCLRGLPPGEGARCPECGTPIEPAVRALL